MPGPTSNPGDGGMNMMMIMMGWLVVATALFLLRPASLRNSGDQKPHGNQVRQFSLNVLYSSKYTKLKFVCLTTSTAIKKHIHIFQLKKVTRVII